MLKSLIVLLLLLVGSYVSAQELDKSFRTKELDPKIVSEALKEVESLMGFKFNGPQPKAFIITKQQVADVLCAGIVENCKVGAFTSPGDQVYINEDYASAATNNVHFSILVHELVHQMQYQKYGADYLDNCYAHVALEIEAYAIQNVYLTKVHAPVRVHVPFMMCPATGPGTES